MALNKDKNLKLFFSISEVAQMFDVNESTLRFWEKEFEQIRPRKNGKGTRYYRQEDIDAVRLVYHLVKERGVRPPQFVLRDVLETDALDGVAGNSVDLITSNPPYVMESEKRLMSGNVLDYEPHLALFVPDDDPLLYYRAVAEWSARLLSEEGVGFTEINEAFGDGVSGIFLSAGFRHVDVIPDLSGRPRIVRYSS